MNLPIRIAEGEEGIVFNPPIVPRSISRANDVVKRRMLAKKMIIQSDATLSSVVIEIGVPQAILAIIPVLAAKKIVERISYGLLDSILISRKAMLKESLRSPIMVHS